MGNYVDEADVFKLMPQLPMTGSTGYSQTADMIDKAITQAEAIIDASIVAKYSLPFTDIPPLIRLVAEELSAYYTYNYIHPSINPNINQYAEQYRNWERNAFDLLEKIKTENVLLTDTSGSIIATRTTGRGIVGIRTEHKPVFDLDGETDQKIDPDLLDEIEDERS